MSESEIRRLINSEIEKARGQQGVSPLTRSNIESIHEKAIKDARTALSGDIDFESEPAKNDWWVYLLAIVVGVVAYFLLRNYKPKWVTVENQNGEREFDNTRGIISAIVVALLVLLGYALMA